MAPASPETLFDARLHADPGRPLVTFYDQASGERAELSAKSAGNWVAKTYSLLVDSLGLAPGELAVVRLPLHWLAAPILLGCWYAGLHVVTEPVADAAVAFADAESLSALGRLPAAEVYAVSLLSMARPATPPPGTEDYALSVRPMPDAWAGVRPLAGPDQAALDGLGRAELVTAAAETATDLGLDPGGRLLWSGEPDWRSALVAPLARGGSTVLVRHAERDRLAAIAAAERCTVLR